MHHTGRRGLCLVGCVIVKDGVSFRDAFLFASKPIYYSGNVAKQDTYDDYRSLLSAD